MQSCLIEHAKSLICRTIVARARTREQAAAKLGLTWPTIERLIFLTVSNTVSGLKLCGAPITPKAEDWEKLLASVDEIAAAQIPGIGPVEVLQLPASNPEPRRRNSKKPADQSAAGR